ncbi:MAG TPA: acyl-CoA dehydrogenase family protein [Acidimicrobiia bacterium]|nr:acyl-CoA dehydrogenase family protein [Acidimicrobiia bacterium]
MTAPAPDLDSYRERARAWLAENLEPRDPSARPRVHGRDHKTREMFEPERALQRRLFDAGYAGITWPVEYGGQGLTPEYEVTFAREARQYRTPEFGAAAGTTFNVCGRTMLAHASPEFLALHVPRMLAGEELWVQFFSEPGAGSDLAGVTSRADRDGDRWILNGAKVWTSAGHYADFGMCLARTDWDVPKHRGLTWFAVDVTAPGVTVSPIRELNGAAEFSQEQFDDVVLTDADVIGTVNDGWTVAQTMLIYERGGGVANAAMMPAPARRRFAPDLVDVARRAGRLDDPHVRQLIAREHIDEFAVGELRKRMGARMRIEGGANAGLASYAKLGGGVTRARRVVTAMEIGRARTLTWAPGDRDGETPALAFLNGRLGCIAGGTNEIQRNGIGERVLGLPREPSFDTTRPFREVVQEAAKWTGRS